MDEIWVAILGLVIALGIVGVIHWLIVGHVNIGSDTNKVILSFSHARRKMGFIHLCKPSP